MYGKIIRYGDFGKYSLPLHHGLRKENPGWYGLSVATDDESDRFQVEVLHTRRTAWRPAATSERELKKEKGILTVDVYFPKNQDWESKTINFLERLNSRDLENHWHCLGINLKLNREYEL